jgi:hypothetical protein
MNPEHPDEPPFPIYPVPPELLEFARQTFNEEEFMAELRAMREQGGGLELKDFIHELEAIVRGESPGQPATADLPCFARAPGE